MARFFTRQMDTSIDCCIVSAERSATTVTARPVEDCKVGDWSEWTDCPVTCGENNVRRSRSNKQEQTVHNNNHIQLITANMNMYVCVCVCVCLVSCFVSEPNEQTTSITTNNKHNKCAEDPQQNNRQSKQ